MRLTLPLWCDKLIRYCQVPPRERSRFGNRYLGYITAYRIFRNTQHLYRRLQNDRSAIEIQNLSWSMSKKIVSKTLAFTSVMIESNPQST